MKYEGVLERLMADALKDGLTPLQVFESAFGKIVNRALANNVSPAMITFELKTCEHQLVNMAIAKAMQGRTVIQAFDSLPNPGRGPCGWPPGR